MSIANIIDILQQQHVLYERLLQCETDKKELIMSNDVVALNVLTQKEQLLTARAEELETNRLLMTARHFKELGFRNRSGILSDLIKSVNQPDEKRQLNDLYAKLTGVLEQLQHINESNRQLIKQSLAFIDFSINLMVEDPHEDVVYKHPRNQLGDNRRNTWFDSKA